MKFFVFVKITKILKVLITDISTIKSWFRNNMIIDDRSSDVIWSVLVGGLHNEIMSLIIYIEDNKL